MDKNTLIILAVVGLWLTLRFLLGRPSAAKLQAMAQALQRGGLLVDVRSPGEFAGGHLPGAINVPLGSRDPRLHDQPKETPVVLYCASGSRSAMAARGLRKEGFAEVHNLGSIRNGARLPRS